MKGTFDTVRLFAKRKAVMLKKSFQSQSDRRRKKCLSLNHLSHSPRFSVFFPHAGQLFHSFPDSRFVIPVVIQIMPAWTYTWQGVIIFPERNYICYFPSLSSLRVPSTKRREKHDKHQLRTFNGTHDFSIFLLPSQVSLTLPFSSPICVLLVCSRELPFHIWRSRRKRESNHTHSSSSHCTHRTLSSPIFSLFRDEDF